MLAILIFVLFVAGANAQIPMKDKCPSLKTMDNIENNIFLGTWYEIQGYTSSMTQGRCISHNFTIDSKDKIVDSITQHVKDKTFVSAIDGVVVSDGIFHFNYTLDTNQYDFIANILYIDSNNSIVYCCGKFGTIENGQMVYIFGRTREMQNDVVEKGVALFKSLNIETNLLQISGSDQDECS